MGFIGDQTKVKERVAPPLYLCTATGVLTHSYCPRSRRCYTRSQKDTEFQKRYQMAGSTILKNQSGKTDTKSSKGLHNYIGTSTSWHSTSLEEGDASSRRVRVSNHALNSLVSVWSLNQLCLSKHWSVEVS